MEKRDDPRIPKEIPLEIQTITYPPSEASPEEGTVVDIGHGGIRFVCARAYEPKAVLQLTIYLQGWQRHKRSVSSILDSDAAVAPLSAVAEVKWSEQGSFPGTWVTGVRFTDIYDDDYQALEKHLNAILQRSEQKPSS